MQANSCIYSFYFGTAFTGEVIELTNISMNGQADEVTSLPPVRCRGIRGATTVEEDKADAILEATRELLYLMTRANDIKVEDVASVIFTTTRDLKATYPALAARQLGWYDTALLCGHEMEVTGGLPRCIRVLIHWNTTQGLEEVVHVYLREAKDLRPDRTEAPLIPLDEIEAAINLDNIYPNKSDK
jgi:chorismate mutase